MASSLRKRLGGPGSGPPLFVRDQQLEDGNRLRGGSERRGDIAALTVDMG